ncbi:hypothetical protein SDC9_180092 [bioreactor metagenome]|uniref:Uncharacterized protein n=1 Tax=bioreactor metagenome TaxID=1076179 RepID=A0A645H2S5_9ZZZZ
MFPKIKNLARQVQCHHHPMHGVGAELPQVVQQIHDGCTVPMADHRYDQMS